MYDLGTIKDFRAYAFEIFEKNADQYMTEAETYQFLDIDYHDYEGIIKKICRNANIFTMISSEFDKIIETIIKTHLKEVFDIIKFEFGDEIFEEFEQKYNIDPDNSQKSAKLLFDIIRDEYLEGPDSWYIGVVHICANIISINLKKFGNNTTKLDTHY